MRAQHRRYRRASVICTGERGNRLPRGAPAAGKSARRGNTYVASCFQQPRTTC